MATITKKHYFIDVTYQCQIYFILTNRLLNSGFFYILFLKIFGVNIINYAYFFFFLIT